MKDVRVVTFNAAIGNQRITTRPEDFLELPFYRAALAGEALLALQEVGKRHAAVLRRAASGRAAVLYVRRPGQGNALVVPPRYELLRRRRGFYVGAQLRGVARALRAGRRNWRQYLELRMWIEAELRDRETGRELTVLCTHVSADGDLKVPQTEAIVGRALRAGPPVILAGDFNVPRGRERGRDVEAAAILRRLRGMGLSGPRDRPDIDYVLADGFEPVSTRIWDAEHLPDAETVSDHYAEDDVLRYT